MSDTPLPPPEESKPETSSPSSPGLLGAIWGQRSKPARIGIIAAAVLILLFIVGTIAGSPDDTATPADTTTTTTAETTTTATEVDETTTTEATEVDETTTTVDADPAGTLRRESFDGRWPFGVDVVIVGCVPSLRDPADPVLFAEIDGDLYALNGTAITEGFYTELTLDTPAAIWLDDGGLKVSLADVTRAAEALC